MDGGDLPTEGQSKSAHAPFRARKGSGTNADGWKVQHNITMNNLINLLIVLLIIGWLVGYIGYGPAVGGLIHILLVVAVIGIVFRLVTGRRANL